MERRVFLKGAGMGMLWWAAPMPAQARAQGVPFRLLRANEGRA
jgi:hypothetical protein